jgi:4a-hydroxytetrahydrobiopterin dehydratase
MKGTLTKKQIATLLKSLHTDWELSKTGTSITRTFAFRSYIAGFMFVTKVSVHSQVALHYPEITLRDGSVKISLTTKDKKSLTSADFDLAKQCDSLYTLSTKNISTAHNHY